MTEKIGWKKKRKPVATNLDVFSNDFNYKNIQLPILEGMTDPDNEPKLSAMAQSLPEDILAKITNLLGGNPLSVEIQSQLVGLNGQALPPHLVEQIKKATGNELTKETLTILMEILTPKQSSLPQDILDKITKLLGGDPLPIEIQSQLVGLNGKDLPTHLVGQIKQATGNELTKETLDLLMKILMQMDTSSTKDDIDIPEWKMPDSAYIPKVPENKDTQRPVIWAFSRLLNRMIDQLNWFLKYFYSMATSLSQPEPSALEVLWSLILIIIIFIVQVIFLLPNIISYITEFIGILFAAMLFEMLAPNERENYIQGILASIEGTNGIVGTCVAFLVTLNIWHSIAQRESERDLVSTIESWMSKTLFGFFRHGLAGALLLNHMFGRMKMGKPMQESNETMLGGGGMPGMPEGISGLMNGVPLGVRASNATARQYEKFIDILKANPTISFIVLFLIIFSSFMGGGFAKLMDSQNTIKSAMGDGGGSPVWYIIVIFCMIASAVSFLAVLPSSFNIAAPLLSGFYILMLLIATLVTFQLGSIGSIMLLFYFMFVVIPFEEFGRWRDTVKIIFDSFKQDQNIGKYKKIFLHYGVIIVFALAIVGSFTRMMVNVSKSIPTKLSGGVFGFGFIGLLLTLLFLYKFVFPENMLELWKTLFPRAKTHTQSAPYTTADNNPVSSPLNNPAPDTDINYGRTIHRSDVPNKDTNPIRTTPSVFSMFSPSNKPPTNSNTGPIARHKSIWDSFKFK